MFLDDFTASRHDSISDRCSAAWTVKDASILTLDSISLAVCAATSFEVVEVPPSCTQFTLDGSKVTLRPNVAYLPKIIPAAYLFGF